jgi:hypothetical protein
MEITTSCKVHYYIQWMKMSSAKSYHFVADIDYWSCHHPGSSILVHGNNSTQITLQST